MSEEKIRTLRRELSVVNLKLASEQAENKHLKKKHQDEIIGLKAEIERLKGGPKK